MPILSETLTDIDCNTKDFDQLIQKKRSYDINQLKYQLDQNISLLNEDQHAIFNAVIQAIDYIPKCFFVNRSGSTKKTFLYNILLANIRSRRKITIAIASSRIATLLISDGRTTHLRFKILIKLKLSSTYNIS